MRWNDRGFVTFSLVWIWKLSAFKKKKNFFTSLLQQEDTLPLEMNVQNGKSRAKLSGQRMWNLASVSFYISTLCFPYWTHFQNK